MISFQSHITFFGRFSIVWEWAYQIAAAPFQFAYVYLTSSVTLEVGQTTSRMHLESHQRKGEPQKLRKGVNQSSDANMSSIAVRKNMDSQLENVLKTFESKIKGVRSYVIKPERWMLEFLYQVNVALVERKYKYMRAKREEIQEVMNEAYGFIALTALTSPGHLDEGQVCTEKGLSTVITDFIRKIHQMPLEVIKIVKLLRVKLLKFFYRAGTWDEQMAADLYTFFKLMIGTRNRFDEMAIDVESKWEELFEATRKQVIRICQVEVDEVEDRIHDAIGDSWDKLNDTSDPGMDEDKLLEGSLGVQAREQEPDNKEYPYFSSSPQPRRAKLLETPVKKTEPQTNQNHDVPPDWHLRLYNTVSP